MQIPCVYLPGPAPAVSVANKNINKSLAKFWIITLEKKCVYEYLSMFYL